MTTLIGVLGIAVLVTIFGVLGLGERSERCEGCICSGDPSHCVKRLQPDITSESSNGEH